MQADTAETYRSKRLPEIEIGLWGVGDAGGPRDEHHERAGGEGEGGGEPRVWESVQHLLVVDVEDDVQRPPCREVDADFDFLSRLRPLPDRDRLRAVGLVRLARESLLRRFQAQAFNDGQVERVAQKEGAGFRRGFRR